ncbi:MAG TPA: hypothetical protein VFH96_09590 [Pyrinomonadaceae bacterium]|nr:hypothetical protein [Pyrinomonadaceae bacterium]
MEASLTHEEFSKHANTKFQVQLDQPPPVELDLVEVSELKIYPQQEEFTILFRGPREAFLDQGVRFLKHDQMGEFELFIVPVSQDAEGFYYEAVFNRIREQSGQ